MKTISRNIAEAYLDITADLIQEEGSDNGNLLLNIRIALNPDDKELREVITNAIQKWFQEKFELDEPDLKITPTD